MKWLGPTWIAVDLDGLIHNLSQIKKHTSAPICAVVKGDAYGHGIVVASQLYAKYNLKYLAVNDVPEALEIREAHIKTPVLILSPSLPQQANEIIENKLTPTVSSVQLIQALAQQAKAVRKTIKIHLKVNTGMNRVGVSPREAPILAKLIKKQPYLQLEGVYTHFATANKNLNYARKQLTQFIQLKATMEGLGFEDLIWHCANSSALINMPEGHLDLVRVGTLLYGQSPVKLPNSWQLQPTWNLFSRIIQIQKVAKGQAIGYGGTFTAKRNSVIGIIPIGYGDGFGVTPNTASNWVGLQQLVHKLIDKPQGIVINTQEYPMVGKVAMGMTCIDLTDHPNALDLYGAVVNIPTRRVLVNRRLPKVYLKNKKVSLIYLQNKLWEPLEKDGQVFFKISNWR